MPPQPCLIVTFDGTRRQVTAGDVFTFGRDATLVVDSANRELHRVQGTLRHEDGTWRLHNNARASSLVVTHHQSPSFSSVAPGTETVLPWSACAITFSAGPANYRIDVVDEAQESPAPSLAPIAGGEATVTSGQLIFNEEQFQLLAVLGEARISGPVTLEDLPTNRQMAQRLGWNLSKVNRKLDNLCIKLDKAGVRGLRGDQAGVARLRRLNLANYAVESGLLTEDTFPTLPPTVP